VVLVSAHGRDALLQSAEEERGYKFPLIRKPYRMADMAKQLRLAG